MSYKDSGGLSHDFFVVHTYHRLYKLLIRHFNKDFCIKIKKWVWLLNSHRRSHQCTFFFLFLQFPITQIPFKFTVSCQFTYRFTRNYIHWAKKESRKWQKKHALQLYLLTQVKILAEDCVLNIDRHKKTLLHSFFIVDTRNRKKQENLRKTIPSQNGIEFSWQIKCND